MSEILVIGGGPAGAAAALRLARAGRSVTLVEKEAGPHDKVCGEFLSYEAAADLRTLGVDAEALGAVSIDRVALSCGRRLAESRLPFTALSLSRRALDEALLNAAAAAGATIRRGARVTGLSGEPGEWTATLDDGGRVSTRQAILATGKLDLRGWKRPAGLQNDLVGFKLHWRLSADQTASLQGRVELYLFPGGYAGLEPVEGGRANLCLLVRKGRLAALGGAWPALLTVIRAACPRLHERLRNAEPLHERPLAAAALPYGYVAGADRGLWRLGDQAAVIPSFAGDGMAIALHSARLAADTLVGGGRPEDFQRRLRTQTLGQVRRATLLSQLLVRAWAQPWLARGAALHPQLLTATAGATRIPPWALPPEIRAGGGRDRGAQALLGCRP